MLDALAYADARDTSLSTMRLLLYAIFWFGIVAALAAIPLFLTWRRAHRYAGIILALALFWALTAAGSAYMTLATRDQWSRDETMYLESGYYDPRDHLHDPPATPWGLWTALALVYGGMLAWSLVGKGNQRTILPPDRKTL